jgi:hypothetical protein
MNKGLRRCGVFFCGYGEKARRPSHKLEETIKRRALPPLRIPLFAGI